MTARPLKFRHFFWPDAPLKSVKLWAEDIDIDGASKPLNQMSQEELEAFLVSKPVRYLDVDGDLDETAVDNSTMAVEAKAQALEYFFLRLREMPIGKIFFRALREFAKADPLVKKDWKSLFPARPSKKDQEEFCREARRYYGKKMNGLARAIEELAKIGEQVPDEHKQFLEYWLSGESLRPWSEHVYDTLGKLEVAFKGCSPCYERVEKSGVQLSKSDWTCLWGFHQDLKAEFDNNAAIDPLALIVASSFKLAHSRCRAGLQEQLLAYIVSLFGGGIGVFVYALICKDEAGDCASLADFKDRLKEEGFAIAEDS